VVDSEADPSKAPSNMQKLVSGERVDFVVGPVHSGVAMAMLKIAREEGSVLIIPNAGLNVATRQLCAPNVFRTSVLQLAAWLCHGQSGRREGLQEATRASSP
jgi:branched-chain amino acid transport system substrate-binding protein